MKILSRYLRLNFVILSLLLSKPVVAAGEAHDALEVGARPAYAITFDTYADRYHHPAGFSLFARGLYRLNAGGRLFIYPEMSWSFMYMGHRSEAGRRLILLPFAANAVFDAPALNVHAKAGSFIFRPHIGLGAYVNTYRSDRASATGVDFGWQAGMTCTYQHAEMKNFFVEIRVEHFCTTNFKDYLPAVALSAGAGYAFPFVGRSISSLSDENLRKRYILDLESNDEERAVHAANEIGSRGIRALADSLASALVNDTRPRVRAAAALAIGRLAYESAADHCIAALENDPDESVRHAAVAALSHIPLGEKHISQLEDIRRTTSDPFIRESIEAIITKKRGRRQ